jgi:hypothetical protein
VTLPDERKRSMDAAYRLLCELQVPSLTPRVPKAIRRRALLILRHHPGTMFDYYYRERK